MLHLEKYLFYCYFQAHDKAIVHNSTQQNFKTLTINQLKLKPHLKKVSPFGVKDSGKILTIKTY